MKKTTWRLILVATSAVLSVGILVCSLSCATFYKGLDELQDLADKIDYYTDRTGRVFLQAEGIYKHMRPYFVNQCASGEIGISKCDRLAIIDTKIVKTYNQIKDGVADVDTILDGFRLAEEALRIQFEALENGA